MVDEPTKWEDLALIEDELNEYPGASELVGGFLPPEPGDEVVELSAEPEDLSPLYPLLRQLEEYLKSYWHDPRFALRYCIGFVQLLQNQDLSIDDIAEMGLQDVKPIERL